MDRILLNEYEVQGFWWISVALSISFFLSFFLSLEAGFENLNPESLAPVSAMSAPKELTLPLLSTRVGAWVGGLAVLALGNHRLRREETRRDETGSGA